ncbi:MAG: HEPN domain-containing protein, partial [Clostridia bacterium]|nr:HEPN domain-containing protein [Clostridia bacterium]
RWVGISIYEEINDIACTELAFAFESLLKQNISISPITSSIQGSISEMVAYICGDTLELRKKIIHDFKDFYSSRSAIVHGGDKNYKTNTYMNFLYLIKNTISKLLTSDDFKKCNNLNDVYLVINEYKFRI